MDITRRELDNQLSYGDGQFLIRIMSPGETEETFYNLIDKEQWNITLKKVKAICEFFPSRTFVTIKEDTKEIIAVATIIPTHPRQYVVGNLVVRQDHRGLGHGRHILKMVMDRHAQDILTLTAVPGVDKFYRRAGFQVIEPTHHVYFIEIERSKVDNACTSLPIDNNDVSIQPFTKDTFPALNDYDTEARGYDCINYLSVMTRASNHFLVATSQNSGQIVGYAAGVEEPNLLWIDGMYADSDAVAIHIFRQMLDAFPDKSEVRIQTVKPREFLVGFGNILEKSRTYTRMSIGPAADAWTSKLYAVADCDYAE